MSNEGWTWLTNSKKWHYFVERRSLCKRFMLMTTSDLEQGNDGSTDNCKACQKALKKRQEKIKKGGE